VPVLHPTLAEARVRQPMEGQAQAHQPMEGQAQAQQPMESQKQAHHSIADEAQAQQPIIYQVHAQQPIGRALTSMSCGHVVPRDALLPLAVGAGPSGRTFDFSFSVGIAPHS